MTRPTAHGCARAPSPLARCAFAALALLLAAAPATARTAQDRDERPGYLDGTHWTRGALRRLAGLGLLDAGESALAWPAPRPVVHALLERAAANDTVSMAPARGLAASFLERFNAEFPRSGLRNGALLGNGWIAAGWKAQENELAAGRTVPSPEGYDYLGPRPRADTSRLAIEAGLALTIARRVWLSAELYRDDVRELALSLPIGRVQLWAGRRRLGFGPADEEGVVLAGRTHFDGIGIDVPAGFVLPGFLRHAGRVRYTQMLARMERSGHIIHPWFLAQRIAFSPHPRFAAGFNRAAIFGGRGNLEVTPLRIFWLLLGQSDAPGKSSDFENQEVSVDVTWRPTPSLPLLVYVEYGFEDAGGAFIDVPGFIAGVELSALPGLPALGLGAEVSHFHHHCCGTPQWYWHGALPEGWTDRGTPLGHSMGGHGTQVALTWRADIAQLGATVRGRLYWRNRGDENLFAPDWQGRSLGTTLRAIAPIKRPLELRLESDIEHARDRSRWNARVLLALVR